MIKWFTSLILFAVAMIISISIYLQPDDLAKCKPTPDTADSCQSVNAIVAISGGDTQARANEAINLYREGWASTLIFSGAAQDKSGPSNAEVMKQLAISAGVPVSAVYIDEYAETTKQNAENAETIFAQHNIKKVILVTSGYHQRRASLEFNKRTNGVTILNHSVRNDKDWSLWWWLSPRGWWLAVSEIVKIIAFYITGSISWLSI